MEKEGSREIQLSELLASEPWLCWMSRFRDSLIQSSFICTLFHLIESNILPTYSVTSSRRRITWKSLPPLKKCITPTLMLHFGTGVQNLHLAVIIAADILTFSVYILSYHDCVSIGDSMLRLSPYYSLFKLTSWRDSFSS